MNEDLSRLKDVKIENYIWIIYIGIIVLSWYANSKEKKYILYNDLKSGKEYQNLLVNEGISKELIEQPRFRENFCHIYDVINSF